MERKRVLVAFGDIRGFRRWIIRAMNSPEIAGKLIDDVYRLFEEFSKRTGYYVKYLGDGLLIIKELHLATSRSVARRFLKETYQLASHVNKELMKVYPRPDGFRIRDTEGHVWKRQSIKLVQNRIVRHSEYIGYSINMAQSLLFVYPEIPCICHEAILELVGEKKDGFSVEHLEEPKERRHGVDPQDFAGLWRVWIEDKINESA